MTLTADNADPITYTVASSPDNSAIVNVFDDDSLPTISIAADSGEVAESAGTAQFMITATGLTATTTLSVNATPAEDGSDFLTDAIADTAADFSVQLSDNDGDDTYNGLLAVPLDDDLIGEMTGDIKLTLNAKSTGYHLGSTTEGVITIWDDDAPELKISIGNPITEADNLTADFVISCVS